MTKMLLLSGNPLPRRRAANPKRRRSHTKRRRARRSNPAKSIITRRVSRRVARRTARRSNPVARRIVRRRRRNPISLGGSAKGIVNMLKDAVIGGAGALAIDVLWGQVNGYLPATLQRVPGQPGIGDGVKALGTILIGKALNKVTRGMSGKAAQASLIVQAHGLLATMLPSSLPMGYYTPGMAVRAQTRIGPHTPMMPALPGMARFAPAGTPSPTLHRYAPPGTPTPFLGSGIGGNRLARMRREGVDHY